jgi:hypothetical protein
MSLRMQIADVAPPATPMHGKPLGMRGSDEVPQTMAISISGGRHRSSGMAAGGISSDHIATKSPEQSTRRHLE